MCNFVSQHRISKNTQNLINKISTRHVPNNQKNSILDYNWVMATNRKIEALNKNKTRNLTDLLPSRKSNWFKIDL